MWTHKRESSLYIVLRNKEKHKRGRTGINFKITINFKIFNK